ncbi:MAG: hypothetical protein ACPG06_09150 [Alphaproteobacteria bacterium]
MKDPIMSVKVPKAANDNAADGDGEGGQEMVVCCQLPEGIGVIEREAELVAQFFGDLLAKIANDNAPETGKNPMHYPPSED